MSGTRLRKWVVIVMVLVAILGTWFIQFNHKSEVASQGASLQGRVLAIASLLHAPGDENTMTVANSSLSTASKMRYEIQQEILAGMSQSQIIDKFVKEYGQSVLAAPSFRGLGSFFWILPAIGMLFLALLVVYVIRTPVRNQAECEEPHKGSHESVSVTRMIEEKLKSYY